MMRACVFHILLALTGGLRAVEPAKSFSPWSAFAEVELARLAKGKIVTAANGSMNFARGISAQAVFLVPGSPEAAVKALLSSDPTRRPEQETYARIGFLDEGRAGFGKGRLDTKIAAVERLLEAMRDGGDLHLLKEERARLPRGGGPDEARQFWAEIMRQRWLRWTQQGDLRATEEFDVRSEVTSLLKEEPKLAERFSALLAPFTQSGAPAAPAQHYWDLTSVNGTAAFCLGTIYTRTAEGRQQALDVTYYASSGYLTSITLYEFVPVIVDGQAQTLAWEACMVSAPALAGGFGVKKAIGSRMMANDLEKSVRFFQQDVAAVK